MVSRILLFGSLLLVPFGCTNHREAAKPKEKSNLIVLVFINPPDNRFYKFKNGFKTGNDFDISYIDDNTLNQEIKFKKGASSDTILIRTKREIIDIRHGYKGLEKLSFLFHNGDTVVFNYDSLKPIPSVKNRKVLKHEIDYELLKLKLVCNDSFSADAKSNNPFVFNNFQFSKGVISEYQRVLDELILEKKIEKEQEYKLLDSLLQNNLITREASLFFRKKIDYNEEQIKLGRNFQGFNKTISVNKERPIFESKLSVNQDSLVFSGYYQDYLFAMQHFHFEDVPRMIKSNSNLPDYSIVYDSIKSSSWLGTKTKSILLLKAMEGIIKCSSSQEILSAMTRFKTDVPDPTFSEHLIEKYKLESKVNTDLILNDTTKNEISLQTILAKNKGKLVYIDFWASWCAPCIAEMPASRKLVEYYKKRGITFVYISLDEDINAWRLSSNKHLPKKASSYVVANKHSSVLLDELQVESIPRYLIYNQQGLLVHRNAPSPSSAAITSILDKLIAN